VKGKFSSSKCASVSQMCKREPLKTGYLLFIANGKATSRYTPVEGDRRGHAKVTYAAVPRPSHLCAPRVPAHSKPTVESPATDASHAEATSVCHCDRRGTESSKPRSRPTDAFNGRSTDAVLRLSQRKAAHFLSTRPTDTDVSVCHVNAHASVAPLHSLVPHR
jgi:hypothetical protein